MLLGKKKPRHDIPCSKCDIYKKLRKNGKVLKLSDNQKSLTKRIALDAYENFISAG